MGLDDYARAISLEKEPFKSKFLIRENEKYPQFQQDSIGYTVILPIPKFHEETITYLGYRFPDKLKNRKHVAQLFKASISHLSGHTLNWRNSDYEDWRMGKNELLSKFVVSLVEDLWVNAYIALRHPSRLNDISLAGALMLERLKPIDNIQIAATRLMATLMVFANTGLKIIAAKDERHETDLIFKSLDDYQKEIVESLKDEKKNIINQKLETANLIYKTIRKHGPIVETLSPPFGEYLGHTVLFPDITVHDIELREVLRSDCLKALRNKISFEGQQPPLDTQLTSNEFSEDEVLLAFDSHLKEQTNEKKILSKFETFKSYRFTSMGFPNHDYTEYVRMKASTKKNTNKMVENLMRTRNEQIEDIKKIFGVLDLTDAIQVIASESDRNDFFLREEKIEQSFAWSILIDASISMRNKGNFAKEAAIILAESANKVLLDSTSWSVFAFSDRFEIIKEFSEQYNSKVKARLGGLEFKGASYMPDALQIAMKMLNDRREDFKVIIIISDGYPYGYYDIKSITKELVNNLETSDIVLIGVGIQSSQMETIFKSNCSPYTMKEFVNLFGMRYLEAYEKTI